MPNVKLIAAIDHNNGLAKNGKLPWDLPTDRAYFREHVNDGPVVMGWKTYISNNFKPYGKGKNYVITSKPEVRSNVTIISNGKAFFENNSEDIWVAGGGQVFTLALPFATQLYITMVKGDFEADVFFPDFKDTFTLESSGETLTENGITFQHQTWHRR